MSPQPNDMPTVITELSCIAFTLLSGILTLCSLDRFLKILLLQVSVWALFYGLGHIITGVQAACGEPIDNQWLMNIHLAAETGLLLFAVRFLLDNSPFRKLPLLIAAVFCAIFFYQGITAGFGVYLHYADLAACSGISLLLILALFAGDTSQNSVARRLACIGMLIYFGCSVPYVALMSYLEKNDPAVNTFLYHLISDVAANLRYLLLAIAFVIAARRAKRQSL
jgi:hypothetical protein